MESIKCVIFGSIGKVKGYERAIKVIEKNPEIKLLIVGPLWNPLEKPTLEFLKTKEKQLPNLKLEIRMLEENEFKKYAKQNDIILLPYYEVVPASGIFSRLVGYLIPMVTWRTTFFSDLEKKYFACLTSGSPEELAKNILKVKSSKKLRNQLKKGAQKLLEENSWENVAKKHLELYKSL